MKKILLSCVTCLLALGLVTACDNEDEVVENDGTTQDTGTGGGSDTGSGGGSSEPITLENYVVSFSFFDEEGEPIDLGDGYSLYLAGSWDNWAVDSWIECSYDETTGYYTGTFTSIVTGTYEYKGVACLTEDGGSWSGDEVVTDNGGNVTLTVTETNSGQVIPVTLVEPTYVYNYTLSLTLTDESGEDPIPSYATAYIAGDWDKWTEFLPLTSEGNGVYSYTFTSITTGWHSFRGYMWYTGETVSWENCVEIIHDTYEENGETLPCDATFEVSDEIADGGKSELSFIVTETLEEEHTSGGSSEPVTLTNYTISFSFVDEAGNATTLGDGYSLYLQGSWALDGEKWADEWIECSYDQVTGYYTGTFTSIDTGTYEYKGVSCLTTDGGSWSGTEVVTDSNNTSGNATLVVTEENSGQVIPVTLETPAEAVYLSNYTLKFSFTYESSETTLPEYGVLYFGTEYDGWNYTELTSDSVSGSTTYSITYTSIAVGSYKYDVVLGYDSGPDWSLDKVVDGGYFTVSESDGDNHTNELSIESAVDFTTLEEITTRTDVTVTWYFVDSASSPTTYYSIPEYADAYVCGYFVGTTWTDYTIDGNTKLVSNSANGYTVTFSELNVGTVTYNMYFEFNGSAQNHSAATSATWAANHAIESDTNNNTTMVIPATGDAIVYIELNPAEIITDDADFCELTLALKDGGSTGTTSTIYYKGSNDGWTETVSLTKTTDNNSYDYYVTFNVDKGSGIEFGIFSESDWKDSLQVGEGDASGIYNNGSNIVIPSSLTNYDSTLIIFACDLSGFTGSGTSHVTTSSISVSHPTVS